MHLLHLPPGTLITMIAAESFDPRLIWDEIEKRDD